MKLHHATVYRCFRCNRSVILETPKDLGGGIAVGAGGPAFGGVGAARSLSPSLP